MKVLIFGATGYVGGHLVKLLTHKNIAVVAHLRADTTGKQQKLAAFMQAGAEVEVTHWNEEAIAQIIHEHNPTHIVCLLGTTYARSQKEAKEGRPHGYQAIDVGLTQIIVHAAIKAQKPPVLVYLSSWGTSSHAFSPYLQARYAAEEAVRSSGLPYLIYRASLITGSDRPEGRLLEGLAKNAMKTVSCIVGALGAKVLSKNLLPHNGAQLAEQIWSLLQVKGAPHKIFTPAEVLSL